MPEGILIVGNQKGNIEFVNQELRDVLKLEANDKGKEDKGLYLKMFKEYNFKADMQ